MFDVNADLLWLFFLFCLSMIEVVLFLRLQNEMCFLLWKISYAEVFSLYFFYIFKKKKKETNPKISMEILWIFAPLYFNFGCM